MKLTEKQKQQIYYKRMDGIDYPSLSLEYGVNISVIQYLIRLIDRYGLEVVKHQSRYYSPKYKEATILRLLTQGDSIGSVAVDLGLSSKFTLRRWIKEYRENGYNVVKKKRGNNTGNNGTRARNKEITEIHTERYQQHRYTATHQQERLLLLVQF